MTKKISISDGTKSANINEMIGSVHDILYDKPNYQYDLKWLLKQDNRHSLFERNPKCILKMKHRGEEFPIFPICNRSGSLDKRMVNFSIRLAKRMQSNPNLDQDYILTVLKKLEFLNRKLEAKPMKTTENSINKRKVTQFLRKISDLRK